MDPSSLPIWWWRQTHSLADAVRMHRSWLWMVTWLALAVGFVAVLAGTLAGSGLGSLIAGYGVLCAVAGAYLGAGLSVLERMRKASAARRDSPQAGQLFGRRVF